ncbi:glycosyl transferase family 1 [Nocardioides phosphati]|uniref:Glycosyl transferase family 1 n=1 Tax=Nocardioides phosphati TaxID=1867775 RepID=A0ABQ2NCX9_9ACTN|nr:glycosyltransferase family 4 protein [Nocardioides phosphati]GGO92500.1 glycosyl transferase family 1 [Nocardioides phosphati]
MRNRPIVVQHSFGDAGSGGPVGALERVLASDLAAEYEFVRMHQETATGGIDRSRLRAWTAMLRDVRPDIVHARGLGNEGFHAVLAARRAGVPRILVSVHGSVRDLVNVGGLRHRVVRDLLEPATLRMASHVTTVCHSAAQRDFIRRHQAKFVGPMTNGVELSPSRGGDRESTRIALGIASDETILISVGRLTFEKGHRALAGSLRLVGAEVAGGVRLLVVGDGPERATIEQAYAGTGIRVDFLGRRYDVATLLQASDVFVFPSLHENLSNALLEAMAAGLPVIASRVGGNVEVVSRGGGLLVEPDESLSVAQAIVALVEDHELRRVLGSEARKVVEDHYSIASMTETLDAIYREMLGD